MLTERSGSVTHTVITTKNLGHKIKLTQVNLMLTCKDLRWHGLLPPNCLHTKQG